MRNLNLKYETPWIQKNGSSPNYLSNNAPTLTWRFLLQFPNSETWDRLNRKNRKACQSKRGLEKENCEGDRKMKLVLQQYIAEEDNCGGAIEIDVT